MKKIILLAIMTIVSIGCSKDEAETTKNATLFCNISTDIGSASSGTAIALVFEDNGKEIDNAASGRNGTTISIVFKDGTSTQSYKYMGSSTVNTFNDVPYGKYILFAYYAPYGLLYYYSIKKVEVNKRVESFDMKFITSGNFGYQEWN